MDTTKEQVEAIVLVNEFFKGDAAKVAAFFNTPNLNIGGAKPNQMFERGRGHKLVQWIKSQLESNAPELPRGEK